MPGARRPASSVQEPTPNPYWEKIGAIDMAPGRMMIFPAEYFHAAWHPGDSFFDSPRLTLVFWMV